jgi:cyclic-di-AMP phosphodiesterase PgpH
MPSLALAAGEDTYRYPGPRPRSPETGIVMIADQLEATARANPPLDSAACDTLVRTTIERIQGERQLDDSGMTGADLARAQRGFSRALQAMYHRRLPYPSSDAGAPPRRLAFLDRSRRRVAS